MEKYNANLIENCRKKKMFSRKLNVNYKTTFLIKCKVLKNNVKLNVVDSFKTLRNVFYIKIYLVLYIL